MLSGLLSLGSRAYQAAHNTGADKLVANYWDDALALLKSKVSMNVLNSIEVAGTVSSVGTLVSAEIGGQAAGSAGDVVTGFFDLNQEKFSEEGGLYSGSRNSHIGKILQNGALAFLSMVPKGKMVAKLGANGAKALYKGIAGWQVASVASDWAWDDHGGIVEDTTDTVMGGASAMRFMKLLAHI